MECTLAADPRAGQALALVRTLQRRFVAHLEVQPGSGPFAVAQWHRTGGRHGGGTRFEAPEVPAWNRASVNVSQVHYDDEPDRRLGSATALSAIVHPRRARAPSIHVHISWTAMRDGSAYWRMMADLNPAVVVEADRAAFERTLEDAAGVHYAHGAEQGRRYFFIPALGRHRGVSHFYLEGFDSGDFEADARFAQTFGEAVVDRYAEIVRVGLGRSTSAEDAAAQLHYHTLYFFQVLTLDRGTTSGLLVHDENDVGILGSLPAAVDVGLLRAWAQRAPAPQGELVGALADVLGDEPVAEVDPSRKRALAQAVRRHYAAHPDALSLQAAGAIIPPTVANHRLGESSGPS